MPPPNRYEDGRALYCCKILVHTLMQHEHVAVAGQLEVRVLHESTIRHEHRLTWPFFYLRESSYEDAEKTCGYIQEALRIMSRRHRSTNPIVLGTLAIEEFGGKVFQDNVMGEPNVRKFSPAPRKSKFRPNAVSRGRHHNLHAAMRNEETALRRASRGESPDSPTALERQAQYEATRLGKVGVGYQRKPHDKPIPNPSRTAEELLKPQFDIATEVILALTRHEQSVQHSDTAKKPQRVKPFDLGEFPLEIAVEFCRRVQRKGITPVAETTRYDNETGDSLIQRITVPADTPRSILANLRAMARRVQKRLAAPRRV